MRDLLPLLFLLACPIMMIFMMRGMHGGQDKSEGGHSPQARHHDGHSPQGRATDARIEQLEREVASLRAVPGEQPEHPRVLRP